MISTEGKREMWRDIPDKRQYKDTTSLKFKEDLVSSFEDTECEDYTILEVGTNHGHTTRILSYLFKQEDEFIKKHKVSDFIFCIYKNHK